MPSLQGIWQARQCGRPSIVTRHSKQMPIPQSGPRGSPVTDRRNVEIPASAMAVETSEPAGTLIARPSTVSLTGPESGMMRLRYGSGGQVGVGGDRTRGVQQLGGDELGRAERGGDAESFVACGQPQARVAGGRAYERQLVRRSGAKARPTADGGERCDGRHVFGG